MVGKVVLGLTLGLALVAGASAQSPLELLRRALDSRRNTVASLLQSQTMLTAPTDKILMKIEYDGQGRSRRTMLQPLRMQGQVMIDDGKSLMVLVPDDRKLKVLTSASRPTPVDLRIELIARNYRLTAKKSEPIAGRSTVLITCRPEHRGMPFRRIAIDEKTFLPLRVTSTLDGKATVLLDTLSFEQPKSMPDTLFRAPKTSGVTILHMAQPIRVSSEAEADQRLPFHPWIPRSLPFGFAAESMEVIPGGPASALAVRLTDGFNIATLYQWDANLKLPTLGDIPEGETFSARDVRMVILGDLPKSVTQRLTEYLSKESLNL